MTPLRRRARRACPHAHKRGVRRCIGCSTIEGEMLHMLERIYRRLRSVAHEDSSGDPAVLVGSIYLILRSEGLSAWPRP